MTLQEEPVSEPKFPLFIVKENMRWLYCEGCNAAVLKDDCPGWSMSGRSRKRIRVDIKSAVVLACWCPECKVGVAQRWVNPSAREILELRRATIRQRKMEDYRAHALSAIRAYKEKL